jgi:HAD superfamily phosphoserine phosphatase-like hydrolase
MKFNMELIVLDLDGTITKSDNLIRFSNFMVKSKRNYRFLLLYPLLVLLKLKVIDNVRLKILFAKLVLNKLDINYINSCVKEYLQTKEFEDDIDNSLLENVLNRENTEVIFLSANYSFLVNEIAKRFSIPDSIAINLKVTKNVYSGSIEGLIPYGENKIQSLKAFLSNKSFKKLISFGDSASDLHLLQFVDEGYLLSEDKTSKSRVFNRISKQ